jgi:hypothetical protein
VDNVNDYDADIDGDPPGRIYKATTVIGGLLIALMSPQRIAIGGP